MAFEKIEGLPGKVYVPEKQPQHQKKHPCHDCFSCQSCSDDRCRLCRENSHSGKPQKKGCRKCVESHQ